jgi:membrane-bound lytic murein transglycosylase A
MLCVVAALAGCAGNQPASTTTFGPAGTPSPQPAAQVSSPMTSPAPATPLPSTQTQAAPVTPATVATTSAAPATSAAAPAPDATASGSIAFSTRHAYYASARFADLPGWNTDDLSSSWDAFKRSCAVLGSRAGWSEPCAASRSVDARNVAAIRQFFEAYFNAYQIRNTDKSGDGTLTGYYEPLLNGSRQYGGAFLYPVYGTPDDMLYLDARRLPDSARGTASTARIDGRMVIPVTDTTPGRSERQCSRHTGQEDPSAARSRPHRAVLHACRDRARCAQGADSRLR